MLGADDWIAAVQSNTDTLPHGRPLAVMCNAAGTITLVSANGNSVQRTVVAGEVLNMRPVRIADTGTSLADADIILLY